MTPELIATCTGATLPRAVTWARHITAAMDEFEINAPLRQAGFLAQIGHESGGLRWMAERWGPTEAQRRYDPPSDLAARLGNTVEGDGYRYRGRGPIQITGRFNYRAAGAALGFDAEAFPELLDEPANACRGSAWFWQWKGLNARADARDFLTITKRINGGRNGLAERQRLYAIAKGALGVA